MSSSYNFIEQKKNSHLYFQVGENKYAINTSNVLEIMKLPALDYPQKLPNNILGLLKYNNFVINVIDLRFYLNIEVKPYSANNELLIVRTDELIFGIIVDRIIGIKPFNSELTDQIPFVDSRMIIESIYKSDNETIFIVNIYALENILKQHDEGLPEADVKALFPQDEASLDTMRKRTLTIAEKSSYILTSNELHAKDNYISFNLNNDFYCISLDYVTEVHKDTSITRVPLTPDYIEGIMNLRGDYITVINLKKFLSLPDEVESDKKPVIIISCNELKLALLIDKINELFEYQETSENEASDSYYSTEFIYNSSLYTVLNVDKISSDKKLIISEI